MATRVLSGRPRPHARRPPAVHGHEGPVLFPTPA